MKWILMEVSTFFVFYLFYCTFAVSNQKNEKYETATDLPGRDTRF